ncbi:MAG: hypothetical protein PWQ82_389 [Thermosediminibacterales bacterium]|nr:hypothetical protein [Thermosediminibacterales bacterium]
MAAKNTLAEIRKNIESVVGKKIKLKANRGRRKTFEKEGIIEKTYPNIFVVKIDDKNNSSRRVSYSYTDILTETVEITVKEGQRKIKNVV